VVDLPYEHESGGKTTGEVAEILEAKYHVMEVFYEVDEDEIVGFLAESLQGALEDHMGGAPAGRDPFAAGAEQIKARFDIFITQEEIVGRGVPGVPTKAARRGVSHRFKSKKNPSGGRPSFVDTGLYLSSFVAWMTRG
jgi:hypothetical protein